MKICHKCKTVVTAEKVFRRDECPSCGADLYVCLNCRFYDPMRSKACREPQSELVKEKDRANYCDFFRFGDSGKEGVGGSAKDEAEKLFRELFQKK